MTQPIPASVPTNGTMLALFVPTLADYKNPHIGELTANTVVDITCYVTGDGLAAESTENNIEDPRLCSKEVYEQPGDSSDTLELTYTYNPASPANDDARLELTRGRNGYIVLRWAVDSEDPIAVGDIVDVYPVTMGKQRKQTAARNSVHRITQKPFVTGAKAEDAVVLA